MVSNSSSGGYSYDFLLLLMTYLLYFMTYFLLLISYYLLAIT